MTRQPVTVAAASVAILLLHAIGATKAGAVLPPAASSQWTHIESANFTCFTNSDPGQVTQLLRDLERLNEVLNRTSQQLRKPRAVPTYIVVFKDAASFAPYNLRRGAEESVPAGIFWEVGDVGYLVIGETGSEGMRAVVYHEFIHSVLFASAPSAPLWLHEGMAEVYRTFRSQSRSAEVGVQPDGYVGWLQENPWMHFQDLFSIHHGDPRYTHEEWNTTFYVESWGLAHMLAVPEKASKRFDRLLTGLGGGRPPGAVFEEVYGSATVDSLEAAFFEYIRAGASIRPRQYSFTAEFERTPIKPYAMTQKESLCRLGDLLIRRGTPLVQEAKEHFDAARRQDPNYAPAVTGLALAAQLEGNASESKQLFATAVGLDPRSPYTLYHAGRQLLEAQGPPPKGAAAATAAADLKQARDLLQRSLAADPNRPYALLALGRTYLFESGAAVEPGIAATKKSIAQIPGRPQGWVTLIGLEVKAGRVSEARRILSEHLEPIGDAQSIAQAKAFLGE